MKPGIHLTIPVGSVCRSGPHAALHLEDLMTLIKIVDLLRVTLKAHEAYEGGIPVYIEPPFTELLRSDFTVVTSATALESRLVRLLGDKNVQVVT